MILVGLSMICVKSNIFRTCTSCMGTSTLKCNRFKMDNIRKLCVIDFLYIYVYCNRLTYDL